MQTSKSHEKPTDNIQISKHYVTMCGDNLTSKGVYYKNTKTLNEREKITRKPLKRGGKQKFKK